MTCTHIPRQGREDEPNVTMTQAHYDFVSLLDWFDELYMFKKTEPI